ncbi:MAG: M16 family metallopeptidase [bacterium]
MNDLKVLLTGMMLFFCSVGAAELQAQSSGAQKSLALDLHAKLPLDPKITVGTLENGLTYYIRENKKPENRAELRLAIDAGSVLEEDDQQGIAHFIEHMAFNGTKKFARQEIIDYLESIGMQFGADINAYTGFDETVYTLQIPTDDAEIVETAFQILEEWAHNIRFEEEEIEKERGVVIEERRLGRGAAARMLNKQFPILFKNSRYAERLPIGKKDILETAPREAFLDFYRKWYSPHLMAVAVVGDFDTATIKDIIERHFSRIPPVQEVEARPLFPVPDHDETLFAIATDVEATGTNVSVYHKHDVHDEQTYGAYRQTILELLYNSMLNNRLAELLRKPEPPFLQAYSNNGRFVRSKDFYYLVAAVKENQILSGLETLLLEANRVKQHGFTQSELDREKTALLRSMERAFNERDKTESSNYADEYIRNFLTGEPLPGIEVEFELFKTFLPEIQLSEVNRLADQWLSEKSRVVMVSAPEKEDVPIPTESELTELLNAATRRSVSAYVDHVTDLPLVEHPPVPGEIVSEKTIPELDVTEWTLSNGVKVVLKPTDFKNDEILFGASSPGGHSLVSDDQYVAAISATAIVEESGLGKFDLIGLQKKLAGKIVRVSPWINSLEEGLSGGAAPQDLETMMQLIYLYFNAPRIDSTAFLSFQNRIKGAIQNRHASPNAAFQDTLRVTMANYHFRRRPWSEAVLDEMDMMKSFQIYRDRFADASDFTFFFVGNFELDNMKPLIQTYLGGLPAIHRKETGKDDGIHPPKGVIEKEVLKGLEHKSRVSLIFTGNFNWNRENRHHITAMVSVLQIKLREVLREELGGTYSVGVWASTTHYPREEYRINISFGCAPERVDELTRTIFHQIDSLRIYGTTEKYLQKVKETQRRNRETDLKENRFWLGALQSYYYHQEDPLKILEYDQEIEALTLEDIKHAAQRYFNNENYVKVVLYPEKS